MPDDNDFENDIAPGLLVNGFMGRYPTGTPSAETQLELEAALARIDDIEVRTRFERLLNELGHRPRLAS